MPGKSLFPLQAANDASSGVISEVIVPYRNLMRLCEGKLGDRQNDVLLT